MESRLNSSEINNHSGENSEDSFATPVFLVWLFTTMSLWGLAFYPVSEQSPKWLARTQFVCFGSMPNGMPADFGWIILFAGPALLFAVFYSIYGSELVSTWKNLAKRPVVKNLISLFIVAFLFESAWVYSRVREISTVPTFSPTSQESLPETYPRQNSEAPNFSLIDQNGKSLGLNDFKGKVILLSFVFAHCQTVCPVLVNNLKAAQEQLGSEKFVLAFITLDPWRDTPAALPQMAKGWQLPPGAHVFSGKPEVVNKVLEDFKFTRERDTKTGDVIHPAIVHIIDSSGKISYTFNNPSLDWILNAAKRSLN